MEVKILASGSTGNCISIQSGGVSVLVDVGLPKTKIEKRLIEAGIDPTKINAIFITHAHGDHIKGLPLANKYRIPVYASFGEWKGISNVDEDLQHVLETTYGKYPMIDLGGLHAYPFGTYHDAYEPLGYAIEDDEGNRCGICLDTGKVTPEMLEMLEGNIYVIEANHDPDMLTDSSYPDKLKARILSDIGHLSNEQTAAALSKLVKGRGERIYLTHLSSTNNWPPLAEAAVKQALLKKGFLAGKHYHLEVL